MAFTPAATAAARSAFGRMMSVSYTHLDVYKRQAKADISVMHEAPSPADAIIARNPARDFARNPVLFAVTDDALDLAEVMDAPIGIFAAVARLLVACLLYTSRCV